MRTGIRPTSLLIQSVQRNTGITTAGSSALGRGRLTVPEQETLDVLEAIETRLETVLTAFAGKIDVLPAGDAESGRALGTIPRIVLRYLDSPWVLGPGTNDVQHVIQIEIVVAPLTNVRRARKEAIGYIRDVKNALFAQSNGGIQIINPPNQTVIMSEGSQWLRNVVYNERHYIAAGVIVRAKESTGETF